VSDEARDALLAARADLVAEDPDDAPPEGKSTGPGETGSKRSRSGGRKR
jgi:hypothetical protein